MKRFVATAALLLPLACSGTSAPPGPLGRPGAPTTGWSEALKDRRGYDLFLRNDSERALVITSVTLYDCENVRGGCYRWYPELTLGPNEWRRVATVRPMGDFGSFRFRWRYRYDWARNLPGSGGMTEETLPDFDSYGPVISSFDIGPDDSGDLTGRYRGMLARRGDTLIVRVESGVVLNPSAPDGGTARLRGIGLGLRSQVQGEPPEQVAAGSPTLLDIELAPGEEEDVGPFQLRIIYEGGGLEECQLFLSHQIQEEDGSRRHTYLDFPGTVGELLESTRRP